MGIGNYGKFVIEIRPRYFYVFPNTIMNYDNNTIIIVTPVLYKILIDCMVQIDIKLLTAKFCNLSEKIHIWPKKWHSYPYSGMRFWPNLCHFGPIRLTIFMGVQVTIIYRLVVRNPSYDAYF